MLHNKFDALEDAGAGPGHDLPEPDTHLASRKGVSDSWSESRSHQGRSCSSKTLGRATIEEDNDWQTQASAHGSKILNGYMEQSSPGVRGRAENSVARLHRPNKISLASFFGKSIHNCKAACCQVPAQKSKSDLPTNLRPPVGGITELCASKSAEII